MTEEISHIATETVSQVCETDFDNRSRSSQTQGHFLDAMPRTISATKNDTTSKKKKRSSKANKQDELESRIAGLEQNFGQKLDLIFDFMAKSQDMSGTAIIRPDSLPDNHSVEGVRRPLYREAENH